MQRHLFVLLFAWFLVAPPFVLADSIGLAGLADGRHVTTPLPSVVFSNATIATAGISLNEFPRSGASPEQK